MMPSPLHRQINSLPELVSTLVESLSQPAAALISELKNNHISRIILAGCGDSYHAAINAQLSFEQNSGITCHAQTAMQFSRYTAPFITNEENRKTLVFGISVSGLVTRTIEALDLARQAGAITVAITGHDESPLAQVAGHVMETAVPPIPGKQQIVPGSRSYYASQLALYLIAIHFGYQRNHLSKKGFDEQLSELARMADLIQATIDNCDLLTRQAAESFSSQNSFVFCGSGPNFGTASFCAAKILEASGDAEMAQDMEEWAHLQYFAKEEGTPTFIISAAKRDQDRAQEIVNAARKIGRQTAVTAPKDSSLAQIAERDFLFAFPGHSRECYSPLLTAVPGLLFASHLAQIKEEPYFRGFKGGRSAKGGGGISKIRDSHRLKTLPAQNTKRS